jgi:hypothetical protein
MISHELGDLHFLSALSFFPSHPILVACMLHVSRDMVIICLNLEHENLHLLSWLSCSISLSIPENPKKLLAIVQQ